MTLNELILRHKQFSVSELAHSLGWSSDTLQSILEAESYTVPINLIAMISEKLMLDTNKVSEQVCDDFRKIKSGGICES